jgi:hypothetical protein
MTFGRDAQRVGEHHPQRLLSGEEIATYDAQDRMLTYDGATYEYTANGELKSNTRD